MEIREIVKDWLEENGYTGLCDTYGECACTLDDLMFCDCPAITCKAGYITEEIGDDGEKGFRIQRSKPQTTEDGE